jgi:hypothetical protein
MYLVKSFPVWRGCEKGGEGEGMMMMMMMLLLLLMMMQLITPRLFAALMSHCRLSATSPPLLQFATNYLRDSSTHLLNGYFAAAAASSYFSCSTFSTNINAMNGQDPTSFFVHLTVIAQSLWYKQQKLLQQFGLLGSSWV